MKTQPVESPKDPTKNIFQVDPSVSDKKFSAAVDRWAEQNGYPMTVTPGTRADWCPDLNEIDGTIYMLLVRKVSHTKIAKHLGVGHAQVRRVASLLKGGRS